MSTTDQRRQHYDTFVTDITRLCQDNKQARGALARGWGRPVVDCEPMDEHLIHRIAGHAGERAHYTVATLIARSRPDRHPPSTHAPPEEDTPWYTRPNLGTALAHGVAGRLLSDTGAASSLKTFPYLDADQLHPRLPRLISRLAPSVHVDFAVLLSDLAWWDYSRYETGHRWREAFYLTRHRQEHADV